MWAAVDRVVSLALPSRCPGCGAVVNADHRFCADCWAGLRMIGPPWCAACAAPFVHDRGADALCGACLSTPPPHAGARAAVAYGAIAKTLVLRLKYAGRTSFAETAARMMARVMPPDASLLIPVPLNRWRLWGRGYNQAALIAEALGRITGVPVERAGLVRARATPVLRGLGRRARDKAVVGAFALGADMRDVVGGARIVLVDDVYTTGATASACARTLARGGAARVTVLTWARVLEADDDD